MPDDPTLAAVMYGPMVLAGRLGTDGLTPELLRAEPTKPRTVPEYKDKPRAAIELRTQGSPPDAWIQRTADRTLQFRTSGQAQDVTLVPFHTVFDERYAVYWRLQ
jgi:hypothetical protein